MLNKIKTLLVNIGVSLTTIIILLLLLEFAYSLLLKKNFQKEVPRTTGNIYHSVHLDSLLGYRPDTNIIASGQKIYKDSVIYSIRYRTDNQGHRVTPFDTNTIKKYAIFLGCSFVFGDGLNDKETIPYLFAERKKEFQPYNFGYSGYGPNHALVKLQYNQVKGQVKQQNGIGFYLYIHDHINRTIGSMSAIQSHHGESPDYEIEDGELFHKGFFLKAHPYKTWIFNHMKLSSFLRHFGIGYPFRLNDGHYDLTSSVLEKISKNYEKQFGNNNFYVIFYPSMSEQDYAQDENIILRLRNKGIKVLDYRKLFNPLEEGLYIHHDNHPTNKANKILVKQILKDLYQE